MNTMSDTRNLATPTDAKLPDGKVRMTPSEAFIETLVAHKVKDVFGIVGSAYMDALDLFPGAGIHEVTLGGHRFRHHTAKTGTGAGDQHGFLHRGGFGLCEREYKKCGTCHQQGGEGAEHSVLLNLSYVG